MHPRSTLVTGFALATLFVGSCQSSSPTRAPKPVAAKPAVAPDVARGWLCIVGGGGTTDDMYVRMLAAAGGNDAKVVILPQASEVATTGANSVEAWKKHGATNVSALDLKDPVRDAEQLGAARVIWFPGGVQTRLMAALRAAGVVELVQQRFRDGAVVGGTSAGAAVMSDVMITGDYDLAFKGPAANEGAGSAAASGSTDAREPSPAGTAEGAPQVEGSPPREGQQPREGRTPREGRQPREQQPREEPAPVEDSGLRYVRNGTNEFSRGLALLPGAIVDQHFVRRQRFNRLLSAVLDHPGLVGIGIDEKTAIFVHGTQFEVLGASNVLVVDPRGAHATSSDRMQPGTIRDVELHVLRAGMRFDFAR